MYRENTLKRRLAAGQPALACWSVLGSPLATELIGLAGFDCVLIDQEHGTGDLMDLVAMLHALSASPATSAVRVPWNDRVILKRILETGVEAIMIPSIETAEEAQEAMASCLYPPRGVRGSGAINARASNFGFARDYGATAHDNLVTILQIESVKAVENLDAILAVDGPDVIFIGPNDLAGTAGHFGDVRHPDVWQLIETAEKKILASGKAMGCIVLPGLTWREMFERGYRFVIAGSDASRLRESVAADVKAYREAFPS